MLDIYVGYDEREAIAYHTFCNSVIRNATQPISLTPLSLSNLKGYTETHGDGSNSFIYSRFLVPYLNDFNGWALFADGDMICQEDISKLFEYADETKAVFVVKHNYETKFPRKYLGNTNENYPRKNWSSVILFNCGHPKNKCLTPDYIADSSGAHLHRFAWLDDSYIGEIRPSWNWLAMEMSHNESAKLIHYTVGTPCFPEYADCDHSKEWWDEYALTTKPVNRINNPT
jgi:lipopolysaccharide biosynthesis glycosyltransferase